MSHTSERPAPRSDPTNPFAQESTGINEAARWANERSVAEPGLAERDQDERARAWESATSPRPDRKLEDSPVGLKTSGL